jgi:hypothetical protein
VVNEAYAKLLPKAGQPPPPVPQFLCQLANISQCLAIDGQERVRMSWFYFILILSFIKQFTLTLWNPTIHPVSHHARVPVRTDYTVRDPSGQVVLSEV